MLDLTKPIEFYTSAATREANEVHRVKGTQGEEYLFASFPGGGFWKFDLDGKPIGNTYHLWRLEQGFVKPKTYDQKIALIEWRGIVFPYGITKYIEEFGVEKYVRENSVGKLLAIKVVTFTEGETVG